MSLLLINLWSADLVSSVAEVAPKPAGGHNREAATSEIPSVLNVKEGMARLGVDLQFYVTIIEEYCKQHKAISKTIQRQIKAGDYKKAFRAAHTLKGASGNISAPNLVQLSSDLEKACLNQDIKEIEKFLPDIEKELEQVINAANRLKLKNTP